jgi:putative NADH-flavin reductase
MKLVILGATGRTGKPLVEQALERGHEVAAVVRNPRQIAHADNLSIVQADATNAAELEKIFIGQDAVISTLGNNDISLRLIERSTRAIVPAMQEAGIKRFITELSFGASKHIRLAPLSKELISLKIGRVLDDQAAGVDLLSRSGLEWTVAFAVRLTNGPLTKRVRIMKETQWVTIWHSISRTNVAYFLLEVLEKHSYIRQAPVIANR